MNARGRRLRIVSTACCVLALGGSGAGCNVEERPPPPHATALAHDPIPAPRRPAARYFLVNTGGRCYVYVEVADRLATRYEELCPRDLRDGERIRLSGHVCVREGGGSTRELLVRCPKGLLYAEYHDRADAGLVPPP